VVHQNSLTSLPESVGSLQLELLDCVDGANQKKHGLFQSDKFETPVLKHPSVVCTQWPVLKQNRHRRELDVHLNVLVELPDSMGNLVNLRRPGTRIATIGKGISNLGL